MAFFDEYLGDGSFVGSAVKFLAAAAGVIVILVKGIDHVDQGSLALKRRMGVVQEHEREHPLIPNPKVIRPGLRILIPFVDTLWKNSVQQQWFGLRGVVREATPGKYEIVVSNITFQVYDVYRSLMFTSDTNGKVISWCERVMRELVADPKLPYAMIEEWLPYIVQPYADLVGVKLVGLEIVSTNPVDYSVLAWAWRAANNTPQELPLVAASSGAVISDVPQAAVDPKSPSRLFDKLNNFTGRSGTAA